METTVTAGMMADGHPPLYAAIRALPEHAARRWIGRCRACKASRKLEGTIVIALGTSRTHNHTGDRAALGFDGKVYTTRTIGYADLILVRCTGCVRFVLVKLVTEGTKESKHTCGARCVNATGPMCDCKCKGANHGSNAPG